MNVDVTRRVALLLAAGLAMPGVRTGNAGIVGAFATEWTSSRTISSS